MSGANTEARQGPHAVHILPANLPLPLPFSLSVWESPVCLKEADSILSFLSDSILRGADERGMGPGSFLAKPLSWDHSVTSSQPSPTLMLGSSL